uniref:VP91/P95 n=1 Tax=Lymantria dispar multicapsid nuclear polyhedrosis virus TaxID=10449 RepID=A0A140HQE0_NPVLD|nr:VP91/P95 [Lymantria dispar multiple nucleopolyhedrovirus]
MLTVSLLLAAIILVVIFLILYLIIYNDFDENEFDRRVKVTLEYMKRTNAEHPLPPVLAYVSHVDENIFALTQFDTNTMSALASSLHDDTVETFNFLKQSLEPVEHAHDAPRVRAHPGDRTKFSIRGDDGWLDVECPHGERFDEAAAKCAPVPVCENKPVGNYPLTARLIDRLVLNRRVAVVADEDDDAAAHPTMYLRCVAGGSHAVLECPENHTFDASSGRCVESAECENRPDGFLLNRFPSHLNADEYLECENGQTAVRRCAAGHIFDRRLLECVAGDPCRTHGAGHTYITADIGPAQYFLCVNASDAELVTCINRVFDGGQYRCAGDSRCAQFPDGTGVTVFESNDQTLKYDTGALACDEYEVVRHIECDARDQLLDRLFHDKFAVGVSLPRQVYDSARGECADFSLASPHVSVENERYAIQNAPNDVGVSFEVAFVGRTERVESLANSLEFPAASVAYARDANALGISFYDGAPVDCAAGPLLFDPFEGRHLNECDERADGEPFELIARVALKPNEYFSPKEGRVRSNADYEHDCARILDGAENYVAMDHFRTGKTVDILQSDACEVILRDLHNKYISQTRSAVRSTGKYTGKSVKRKKNIEVYGSNIRKRARVSTPGAKIPTAPLAKIPTPLFVPFETIPTAKPLFDPFAYEDANEDADEDADEDKIDEDEDADADADDDEDEDEDQEIVVPPPELTLSDKMIDFSCFYSVPTFETIACSAPDEHVQSAWREAREAATVHPDCAAAAGLVNIVNAYAYLGEGVKCKSGFDAARGLFVDRVAAGPEFADLTTQSNDGVKYNRHVHARGGLFVACPEDLFDDDAFACRLKEDKIYFIQDLHE